MRAETTCEVCRANDWQAIGRRTYLKSNSESLSEYDQKRFKVLFDRWFPGKDKITLTSILCTRCGLIIYVPRPETTDIDSKYRYLEELGQDYGGVHYGSDAERRRSRALLLYLSRNLDLARVHRILDYGGGGGRLMLPFRALGKECYLVDYNRNCIEEVTKLSDTIEGIDSRDRFDLIFCSHVIEHVAQPLQIMKRLVSHLEEHGHIFVEVPMEVWKKAPLHTEPVTHVNFFTRRSLYNFLRLSGLEVERCELTACPHPSGKDNPGIRAIGTRWSGPSTPVLLKPDGLKLLSPSILGRLRYHTAIRGGMQNWIKARLSRFIRRR